MLRIRRPMLVTLLFVAASCGGDIASPERATTVTPALQRTVDGYTIDVRLQGDTTLTTILVDPSVNASYSIDRTHKLWLRAGAICNPLTSGYGPRYWYEPCESLMVPITIVAKSWRDDYGHPRIDFAPELRFTPLSGKREAAVLYMKDKKAVRDTTAVILYCPSNGGCYDESLSDPDLVTRFDTRNGFVYREIKHFSGYNVALGRTGSTTATEP